MQECVRACSVFQSGLTLWDPVTPPGSSGFSRREYWSELPFPSPGVVFPCGSAGKESTCNAGDLDLTPGWGRSPGEGNGYPLQYSGLEKSMGSQRVGHN